MLVVQCFVAAASGTDINIEAADSIQTGYEFVLHNICILSFINKDSESASHYN